MSWLDALILGIVQGLTEFFPVSSSGHLVLGQTVLGLEVPGIVFDVLLHVATLVSVTFVYREKLMELIRGLARSGSDGSWPYVTKIVLATIPAAVIGLSLRDWFEARFDDPVFAATMILVTGSVVWSSRWAIGERRPRLAEALPLLLAAGVSLYASTLVPFASVLTIEAVLMALAWRAGREGVALEEPTYGTAALMGMAQAVAIFPGISRSGSTVLTGLWRRLDPAAAAEFSFLMSIPAILGAAVLQLPDAIGGGAAVAPGAMAAGFAGASISGILAIRFFVALLKRRNFFVFAYYCWAVGTLFLLLRP